MLGALERHDAIIGRSVADAGGVLLKARGEGDSTFSVFNKTSAAVVAALAVRDALAVGPVADGFVLPVRFAIHVGEAHERDGDYYGPTVNRAARIRSLADGGQILLSESVAGLVRDELPDGWDLAELGEQALRGLSRPERLFTLVSSGGMAVSGATVVARSCPYMGLLAFQPEDARLFFGRAGLVATLIDRLERDGFIGVVGPSGSGKSSLVRAGAIAGLRRTAPDATGSWITILMSPGARPLAELAARMAAYCDVDARALLRDLETDPRSLDLAVRYATSAALPGTRFALVVDQFEELFTLCDDERERQRFLDAIVDAAASADQTTHVAIALRADFVGHCTTHHGLADLLGTHTLFVGAMDEDGVRAAIEGPAGVAGLAIEPGLVDVIARDVTGEPGALPLLSHALLEMWSHRDGRTLTIEGYRAGGGVAAAIGRTADAVYETFTPEEQEIARRVFLRLTELGEGTEDTRRRVTRDELDDRDSIDSPELSTVLDTLAKARLVTVSESGIEVAHEALITQWPRLRKWLDDDREGLRVLRRVTNTAREWDASGRDDGDLYRGARLTAVLEWRAGDGHGQDLNPLEREYINAAETLQNEEIREADERVRSRERSYRVQRRLLIGTAIALVLAMLTGVLALSQRNTANAARDRAAAAARTQEIDRMTERASTLPARQLDLALLLGVEAHHARPGIDTEGALEAALTHTPTGLDSILGGGYPDVSADGRLLAATDQNGAVQVVDLQSGEIRMTLRGRSAPFPLAFDPTGSQLVGGVGSAVTVWNVATGQISGADITPGGNSVYAVWDPADASRLFTISAAATIQHWDRHDPQHPQRIGAPFDLPPPSPDIPVIVRLSGDGRLLAASSNAYQGSTTTTVWDVAQHTQLQVLAGSPAAFESDNETLALTAGNQVVFDDARTGQPRSQPLTGLNTPGVAVISRDGRRLAVLDAPGMIKIFDLATRTPSSVLDSAAAIPIAFLPDGRLLTSDQDHNELWNVDAATGPLATALGNAPDKEVQARYIRNGTGVWTVAGYWTVGPTETPLSAFWDTATGRPLDVVVPPDARIDDVSRDGRLAAAELPDGSVGLLDLSSGQQIGTLGSDRGGERATFAPDGTIVATVPIHAPDQTVKLWDVRDPHSPRLVGTLTAPGALPAGKDSGLSTWFSPDGRVLAVTDGTLGSITVFDVASRQQQWTNTVGGNFYELTFTPDGRTLAVIGTYAAQFRVRFLDTRRGEEGRSLSVPQAVGVAYANGGTILATTSMLPNGHGAAQLWDAATHAAIGVPLEVNGAADYADASPDGEHVMAGGSHGRVAIWNLDVHSWETAACKLAGRNLTHAEWREYLPDQPYRSTCPQWSPGQ
jgi:WD40 repeat protein